MRTSFLTLVVVVIFTLTSCQRKVSHSLSEVEAWKLSWRMIESIMFDNYLQASMQFDSLLSNSQTIDSKYLAVGLEAKNEIGNRDEILEILESQTSETIEELCRREFLRDFDICKDYSIETVTNKELQLELIKMYINDQYARSNLMTEMLEKYNLKKNEVVIDSFGISTDVTNTKRLKEIIKEYGFPTKEMVGRDAMRGIFFIIQHSDRDQDWQKSQLENIEKAVKEGSMDGQSYAYLYDRIKRNSGEKQKYGTQFAKVDPVNRTVKLGEVEDVENLDQRRMEIGMMPIEMYERLMLDNL